MIIVTSACSAHRGTAADATQSPLASPAPLLSCEARELRIDGVDMIVQANVDATLGTIVIVRAPDDAARARAIAEAQSIFGRLEPDNRRMNTPNKWGFPVITDPCGRPLTPTPETSPSS